MAESKSNRTNCTRDENLTHPNELNDESETDCSVLQAMQVCPHTDTEDSQNDPELETRYIYTNSATAVQSTNLDEGITRVSDQLNELSDINRPATMCVADGKTTEKNVNGRASNLHQQSDEMQLQDTGNQVGLTGCSDEDQMEGESKNGREDDDNQEMSIKTEHSSDGYHNIKRLPTRITRSSMNLDPPEDIVLTLRQTQQELVDIRRYLDARLLQSDGAGNERKEGHVPGSTIYSKPESTAHIMQTKLLVTLGKMDQLSYLVYMRSLAESLANERMKKMEEDIYQLRLENSQLQRSLSPKKKNKKHEIPKRKTNRIQTQKHEVITSRKKQLQIKSRGHRRNKTIESKQMLKDPKMPKPKSNRILTRGKPFKCEICGKNFATQNTLNIHYSAHTDERPFKCNVCFKNFKQEAHMKKHKCGKDYSCDLCGRHYLWPSEIKKHIMTHLSVKPHQCKTCGKSFSVVKYLKVHQLLHTGVKKHVCDICGLGFNRPSTFRQHKNRHLGLKPYQCDICGKAFPCGSDLTRHKLSHSDAKPLQCSFCDLRFHRRYFLKLHEMTHTGEKPFICEVCGMRFKTCTDLKKHVRIGKHTGKNRLRRQPHDCDICGRHFRSITKLADHKMFHASGTMYQCDICGKSYKTNRARKTHKREHKQIGGTAEKSTTDGASIVEPVVLPPPDNIAAGSNPFWLLR